MENINSWKTIEVDCSDKNLFGNDAAEEEKEEIFFSYALEPEILDGFLDNENSIQVVRAFKGEGKSALLRITKNKLQKSTEDLIINTTAVSISPILDSTESDIWTRKWKESILNLIANEIGSNIGFAYTDDAMNLVEEAENNGFKEKSFLSSIITRLKIKNQPLEINKNGTINSEKTIERWLQGKTNTWLIIDDIDQNFINKEKNKIKVASFFTACRQISNTVPEIRFRLSIRPNVWKIIKREYEALSHIEQYIHDLNWSDEKLQELIAKRVEGYFKRKEIWEDSEKHLSKNIIRKKEQLLQLIFEDPMPWGIKRERPAKIVLSTLSRHRPRWLIELSKESSKVAKKKGHNKIYFEDIDEIIEEFGRKRIDDTIAEFKSQCSDIEEILSAFANQDERYSTADLLKTIKNRIIEGTNLKIEGVLGNPTAKDVAHFLYQIGFITGRKDHSDGTYDHISFDKEPTLLKSRTNIDQGVQWEIHPVFRQPLNLKNIATTQQKQYKKKRT